MYICDFGRVLEKRVVEGVEFWIIDRPETAYAGAYTAAASPQDEPDGEAGCAAFEAAMGRIAGNLAPETLACISLGYHTPGSVRALMHCAPTDGRAQPEGICTKTLPGGMYAAVEATAQAWALTGRLTGAQDPIYHMAPLFATVRAALSGEYEFDARRDHEIEIYSRETRFVAVPVNKII